ncbi:hypothetical protein QO207_04970 [Pseudomonas sp. CAN2814]|uniref:hypothetical protein n=1 Tax=Pseudomonas sp. CAN1 TaxID=3046726 RepID=UPI002649ABB4|nr:hypothetical protein [Pseudomonas sp. CAN1]MDN6855934.1 hypothetical protein [Pseudomonas sp. CAN1]
MLIQLKPLKRLGYPEAKFLPALSDDVLNRARAANVLTFRSKSGAAPDRVIKNVSALTRLDWPGGDAIVLLGLQTDSPLAPLILWDLVHAAPVGATIELVEAVGIACYLTREYFQDALVLEESSAGVRRYRKIAMLDAEHGSLDEWTFGIPSGPDDATLLNACVARILELPIPKKEILLCGRPSDSFLYWEHVRIVGEDITAPPLKICSKKNRLAEEAKYENLCIVHDRVFLPDNFQEAIQRFGNAYPLTAFQSLYFDDHTNFCLRRYSDFFISQGLISHRTEAPRRDDKSATSRFAPAILERVEDTAFAYANGHRYSANVYPSGSLYLVKKRVWARIPQDESLLWTEFEDVEQGERAGRLGIPSRINPYAFTQSMLSRSMLNWLGTTFCENQSGDMRIQRTLFELVPFLSRKPVNRKTQEQAARDHTAFMARWGIEADASLESPAAAAANTKRRLRWLVQVIHAARIPLRPESVRNFINDVEKLVVSEQIAYQNKQAMARDIVEGSEEARAAIILHCSELVNQSAQRPGGRVFAKSLSDYLPRRSLLAKLGSFASAWYLWRHRKVMVATNLGLFGLYRAIVGSTPWASYKDKQS